MTNNKTLISNIMPRLIEDEMRQSYLDYAMSVIVSRALPDVRDGLKPVHRRILYAMFDGGYVSSKPYKKSSRIVGDVMGKYHPHGDSAIYDAMVRMVQEFSMRLPLVDGQGNFGSMDGDSPAAMRYTEARLNYAAEALLLDIEKQTVDLHFNYDETILEPIVLPASYPNLLVNGATGIAVGMATNIPTHNLGESIDACLALIDNSKLTNESLMQYIPGPDFPTGGMILGSQGIQSAYCTGRGSITIRAKHHMETHGNRDVIVFTEIPYQVNKSRLIERIAELVHEKIITAIAEMRDESDRDGVRVVIELKRESVAEVVLSQLYKHTSLQTSFGVNMIALHKGRPTLMTLYDIIQAFIEFRENIIIRRTRYELEQARNAAHILAGLLIAVRNLDLVIGLIRQAKTPKDARESLMFQKWNLGNILELIQKIEELKNNNLDYQLSEVQARSILELQLQRLTRMEYQKLLDEAENLKVRIARFLILLSSHSERMLVVKKELLFMKEKLSNPRRTEIIQEECALDFEDLIEREDMVVTVTNAGYVKRAPLSAYRAQRRGGKGRSGMETKEDDAVTDLFIASTHDFVLFFSSKGMAYQLKVHQLPAGQPQSRGRAFVNFLPLDSKENITAVLPMTTNNTDGLSLIFVTSFGTVRRNSITDFENIRVNGKIAMKLKNRDHLVKVLVCQDSQDVLLSTHKNMIIRFPVRDVRIFSGRDSVGVRGISLKKDDYVVSMAILNHGNFSVEERDDYLRAVSAETRLRTEEYTGTPEEKIRDLERKSWLEKEPFLTMRSRETYILTVSTHGMGQLCSFYEYRTSSRGGKGVVNMDFGRHKNAEVVASFPVDRKNDVMLATDVGQVIRLSVKDIRVVSRNSKGVILVNLEEGQKVVSAVPVINTEDNV